jgi:AraC-like DNA-binding protein
MNPVAKAPPAITEFERTLFAEVANWIADQVASGTIPKLSQAAVKAGFSMCYFHRRFALCTGQTFKDLVTTLQIAKAKALLLQGIDLVGVATKCGFTHQSHFSSRFKHVVGQTPSRWRRDSGSAPAKA